MGLIKGLDDVVVDSKEAKEGKSTPRTNVKIAFWKSDKGQYVKIFTADYTDNSAGKDAATAQLEKFKSQYPSSVSLRVTNDATGEVYAEASGTKPTMSDQLAKPSNQKIIVGAVIGIGVIIGISAYLGTKKK